MCQPHDSKDNEIINFRLATFAHVHTTHIHRASIRSIDVYRLFEAEIKPRERKHTPQPIPILGVVVRVPFHVLCEHTHLHVWSGWSTNTHMRTNTQHSKHEKQLHTVAVWSIAAAKRVANRYCALVLSRRSLRTLVGRRLGIISAAHRPGMQTKLKLMASGTDAREERTTTFGLEAVVIKCL